MVTKVTDGMLATDYATAAELAAEVSTLNTAISALSSVPQRQCALYGPANGSGLANFLPSTSVNLNLTTTGISGSEPLYVNASNKNESRNSVRTTNLTWSSLPASNTSFLYVDVAADGTLTTGHTTLRPSYIEGGTASTTSGQATFKINEMVMYVGNGSVAAQTWRVFLGQAVTGGSTVTSTVTYAYRGRSVVGGSAPAANSLNGSLHNLGVTPRIVQPYLTCTTTNIGFNVGDNVYLSTMDNASDAPSLVVTVNSVNLVINNGGSISVSDPIASHTRQTITLTSWALSYFCERGW